jgi:hypothetical protein
MVAMPVHKVLQASLENKKEIQNGVIEILFLL